MKLNKRVLLIIIAGIALSYFILTGGNEKAQEGSSPAPAITQEQQKKGVLRTFSGPQFRQLYDSIAYPNSEYISEKSPITASPEADERIRQLAEKRGYQKRSAPVEYNFKEVSRDMLLQERAAVDWLALQKAAKRDGRQLTLTAAYRSADGQKKIFLDRLGKIPLSDIAGGKADDIISNLLKTTAIPGYSRHHTGYTVDIACQNDPNVIFEKSACFDWLSSDNYKNAKTYGWIPSYPDGAGLQGPDPEAWEYVWVGKDAVTE